LKGRENTLKEKHIMKSEDASKLATSALETLAQTLAAGHSEALTAYLAAAGRFHTYSFRNVMLIASQRPDATRVAGFNAWRKLGRFVKKGETGIAIIAHIVLKRDDRPTNLDDERARDVQIRFKVAHVFDVVQTDGTPLPELGETAGDPGAYTQRLIRFIESLGIALDYADDLGGADGLSKKGQIVIRSRQTAATEFSVLVHELAHSLLHQVPNRPSTKTVLELEAEAVAFTVCSGIGLDTGTAAADYIGLYDGDADLLAQSLDAIQRTASQILEAINAG
jgi:antirestriction protein ArdC